MLNVRSHSIFTTSGVPQGSPLTPVLFNFAISPLYKLSNKGAEDQLYADDKAVLSQNKRAAIAGQNEIETKLGELD